MMRVLVALSDWLCRGGCGCIGLRSCHCWEVEENGYYVVRVVANSQAMKGKVVASIGAVLFRLILVAVIFALSPCFPFGWFAACCSIRVYLHGYPVLVYVHAGLWGSAKWYSGAKHPRLRLLPIMLPVVMFGFAVIGLFMKTA